jgi:hypothetical protein
MDGDHAEHWHDVAPEEELPSARALPGREARRH